MLILVAIYNTNENNADIIASIVKINPATALTASIANAAALRCKFVAWSVSRGSVTSSSGGQIIPMMLCIKRTDRFKSFRLEVMILLAYGDCSNTGNAVNKL